jgi:hypothetical protein
MPDALHFLIFTVAGWLNRHQEDLIEYLREENRVLREQLVGRPLRLTPRRMPPLSVPRRVQKLERPHLMENAVERGDPRVPFRGHRPDGTARAHRAASSPRSRGGDGC